MQNKYENTNLTLAGAYPVPKINKNRRPVMVGFALAKSDHY